VGEPALTQPRVYYGEGRDVPFVVVGTGSPELDYEGAPGGGERRFSYDGEGGIEVGGFFRRLLFAWRYRDVNLLISGLIRPDSRVMIYRDIRERAVRAAPFLQFDGDPYAAIVDGRIVWIWDAYTTTSSYPYSQPIDIDEVVGNDQAFELHGTANYVRNSVKVVIDAYDGTMTYYVSDPEDPIVQVWRRAFPELFTDLSEAPPELRAHFRYPEDLFRVQAAQFANYHVTNPDEFYRKQDFWAIPPDPTIPANAPEVAPGEERPSGPLRPYYVLMRLPGGTEEEFVLILPFVPEGRQNMVAWMAARSDPERYGELVAYQFPTGRNVDGPTQVFAEMRQDPRFSAQQTLLGQVGSRVLFGDFLPIPLGRSILYVQPVYVRSEQEAAIPQLKFVLAVSGGGVGLGSTLAEAVSDAVGAAVPEPGEEGPPPAGTVAERIAQLLEQAATHFQAADEALRAGDLATYQREIEAARAAVEQARELAGEGTPAAAPTPSP